MKKLRVKKWLVAAVCVLLGLAVLGMAALLIIDCTVKSASKGKIVSETEAASAQADCILVLGAGVWNGNTPSPMLADRLDCAIRLYFAGAAPKLLMSGDHGSADYDEVNVMKDYAIAAGVPSEDIFMDHAGFSTYESIYRARDIFEVQRPLIVTQRYHMYRALYIADALGLDACGVSADTRRYAGQSYRAARELLARAKDFVQCITQPEPTFLGETIPITGNGNQTNDRAYDTDAGAAPT